MKAGAILNVTGAAGGFTLGGAQILSGTGSVTGTATIASGGTIQPGNASGTGTLTLGGLTFGAPANISITNNTTPATIAVTGANSLIANTGASVAINLPPVAPPIGTYVLIDYSGSIGGTAGFGAFHLGTLPNRLVANLVNNAGNTSIDLNVSGVDFPIWTGAQSSEWSTNTISPSKNWALNSNNATGTDFLTNDPVIFNDLATGTTVNVTVADVQPVSVTFNNTNNNFNITGTKAIIGATGITKSGAGRLTISNTNSFTGAVAVNGGTVSVASVANNGANSALGSGSSVTFNGGTLEYTGASGSTNRALTLNAGGGTLQTDNSLTLAGAIGGAGALTKTGAGTVILTGANGYGATVISSGALQVGDGGTTGTLGSGTITNNSDLVFNRSGANLVVGGAISGTGTVTNNGAGTAVLAGANSYGATVINSGTLQVGNGGATGTLGAGSVTNNGILAFNRSDTALVVTNAIDGTGSVRMNGVGTVTLGGPGSNSYSGGTTVSSGILVAGKAAGLQAIPGDLIISTGAAFRLGASDQIADGAVITINGGTFGDLASIAAPATGGPIDTVDTVIVNGGNFLSNRNLAGFTISTLLKVTAGTALVQRGGAVHVGAVEITGGAVSLDGGSTTGGNESRLNVGGGGILMTGGAINFNNGPSALTATSQGSKLLLTGNVTTVGTNSFARLNPIVPKAELDLGGVGRNFDVTGTLTIGVDVVNGDIVKEGPGKLVLNGLGSSYSTLTANAGRTDINESSPFASVTANAAVNFTVSQNLSDLTIGDGAVVTVGSPAPPAPPAFAEGIGFDETAGGLTESAAATVPEPCGTALLFGGLATLLGLRRNGRKRG